MTPATLLQPLFRQVMPRFDLLSALSLIFVIAALDPWQPPAP